MENPFSDKRDRTVFCFFLPSLLAAIVKEIQKEVMTNTPWGYGPIVPINPFHHLIRLETCVTYMTELLGFVRWRQMSLHFNLFSLKSIGPICKGNLIILHYLKILYFRISHLFSCIWFPLPVELVIVISFGINSLAWLWFRRCYIVT